MHGGKSMCNSLAVPATVKSSATQHSPLLKEGQEKSISNEKLTSAQN